LGGGTRELGLFNKDGMVRAQFLVAVQGIGGVVLLGNLGREERLHVSTGGVCFPIRRSRT